MEDAGQAIDAAAATIAQPRSSPPKSANDDQSENPNQSQQRNRKRKAEKYPDSRMRYGSRTGVERGRDGGRGGRRRRGNDDRRHPKGDLGRGEYFRDQPDKRQKTQESREKREREGSHAQYGTQFSQQEIDAEERRPKRKVAVLIGYAGTGYKGMQITPTERTIEGDLFAAFIRAGAISKANADDPRKAGLVRCARTDKGVHAAGNMISLKLIVEDDDIVQRINEHLDPQIRVWAIERTIGSFSCYQACDSRWYEYLIPSHAFLPPHPSSWLAKQLEQLADEVGDRSDYEERQADVDGFWARVDQDEIQPILDSIDDDIRFDVVRALQGEEEASAKVARADADLEQTVKTGETLGGEEGENETTEEAAIIINDHRPSTPQKGTDGMNSQLESHESAAQLHAQPTATNAETEDVDAPTAHQPSAAEADRIARLRAATKRLRTAYMAAKRRYRIPPSRVSRIQSALDKFVGTSNFHNYTIQKTHKDPSAKRHIKSFVVNTTPILIGDGDAADKSEWLSLKVHGQSFMMHQIRKMVGMVALLVRCGSSLATLSASLGPEKFSIPKVPGLGLLLERPVFDTYNNLQAVKHDRPPLLFSKCDEEISLFKEREIYQRIFREEEERSEFARFFNHVDNFKEGYFLFVTSKGIEATKGVERKFEGDV